VAEVSLTGLAASDPVPGEYVEVAFAQGPASLATAADAILVIGNMLATGAGSAVTLYGPDTVVPMTGADDASVLFGPGAELHRQLRQIYKLNKTTPVYAIACAENGSGVAGTCQITITGTATGSGALRVYLDDEFVDTGFVTGDTPTVMAAAAIVQINANTHWMATAGASAGVITLTSKQKGPRANLSTAFARVIPFSGSGVTVSPSTPTAFASGAGADSVSAALAAIVAKKFYYIVPAHVDSTNLNLIHAQIVSQALPVTGIRQRMVVGSKDSLANAITVVDGMNGARVELVWLAESNIPPSELAAKMAAIYTLGESSTIPRLNFNSYGEGDGEPWSVSAPLSGAAPTRSQIYAALNAGVSPIGVRSATSTYLVKRVTTRYKNGAVVDYRIRDPHKVLISDRYATSLSNKAALQLRGKSIGNDPIKNEPTPGPSVTTPRLVKTLIDTVTTAYGNDDLLQNVSRIKANTVAIRSTSNTSRIGARVPLEPVDILDQLAFRVDQVG